MSAFAVRPATKDDADAIIELWKGYVAFLSPRDPRYEARPGAYDKWRTYFLNRMVNSEHAALFVAEADDQLVGIIEARVTGGHPVFKVDMHGHLYGHFVVEAWRGQGVGAALIQAAEAWFGQKGLSAYRVAVLSWLPEVKAAYEATGLEHAEWIMEKHL